MMQDITSLPSLHGATKHAAVTARTSPFRPISHVSETTEIFDTDFEDESDFDVSSQKGSFESDDSRRRSQTTISTYEEARTPSPRTSTSTRRRPELELRIQPVQGPKGPHLFRSSQVSSDFGHFEYALQMSPLLPKEQPSQQPPRATTAFSEQTLTPITQPPEHHTTSHADDWGHPSPDHVEAHLRSWPTEQVIDWMYQTGFESSIITSFELNDINGAVLLDLEFEDLKELGIQSFGKRHQLWNAICMLRGDDVHPSPQPTPFQDISRPCTSEPRGQAMQDVDAAEDDCDGRPHTPSRGKSKRRGRKPSKTMDIITPAESVSIVAIEQLLPKPHKCAKGDRCAKWRKQQRELQQLQDDHAIGRFPISPTKGGHIFVAGNPGNAGTADSMLRGQAPAHHHHHHQHLRLQDTVRPTSQNPLESAGLPSVVASSALLGPGQLPEFALHEDMLHQLGSRDPQDNVKTFLQFQHIQSPVQDYAPPSPPYEMFPSQSVSPFPAAMPLFQNNEAPAMMQHRDPNASREQLRHLPKLEIPRSQSADPQLGRPVFTPTHAARPMAAGTSISRAATASPGELYRLRTPVSEMDPPRSAVLPDSHGQLSRDTSQSVPPSMQFRPQQGLSRSHSRAEVPHWRRPSFALPAVKEGEVFSPTSPSSEPQSRPSISTSTSSTTTTTTTNPPPPPPPPLPNTARDPSHHSPITRDFGYGPDCTHAGWMRKRRTKLLRHEWNDAHFRLRGSHLTQHASARLSADVQTRINVDDYAVACASVGQNRKLSAALKALAISRSSSASAEKKDAEKKGADDDASTAFAFQLVPAAREGAGPEERKRRADAKTHHFAVRSKDERIDWMRELMLAKAREQKGKGYDVQVNGVQA